jgi:hypothetical protein
MATWCSNLDNPKRAEREEFEEIMFSINRRWNNRIHTTKPWQQVNPSENPYVNNYDNIYAYWDSPGGTPDFGSFTDDRPPFIPYIGLAQHAGKVRGDYDFTRMPFSVRIVYVNGNIIRVQKANWPSFVNFSEFPYLQMPYSGEIIKILTTRDIWNWNQGGVHIGNDPNIVWACNQLDAVNTNWANGVNFLTQTSYVLNGGKEWACKANHKSGGDSVFAHNTTYTTSGWRVYYNGNVYKLARSHISPDTTWGMYGNSETYFSSNWTLDNDSPGTGNNWAYYWEEITTWDPLNIENETQKQIIKKYVQGFYPIGVTEYLTEHTIERGCFGTNVGTISDTTIAWPYLCCRKDYNKLNGTPFASGWSGNNVSEGRSLTSLLALLVGLKSDGTKQPTDDDGQVGLDSQSCDTYFEYGGRYLCQYGDTTSVYQNIFELLRPNDQHLDVLQGKSAGYSAIWIRRSTSDYVQPGDKLYYNGVWGTVVSIDERVGYHADGFILNLADGLFSTVIPAGATINIYPRWFSIGRTRHTSARFDRKLMKELRQCIELLVNATTNVKTATGLYPGLGGPYNNYGYMSATAEIAQWDTQYPQNNQEFNDQVDDEIGGIRMVAMRNETENKTSPFRRYGQEVRSRFQIAVSHPWDIDNINPIAANFVYRQIKAGFGQNNTPNSMVVKIEIPLESTALLVDSEISFSLQNRDTSYSESGSEDIGVGQEVLEFLAVPGDAPNNCHFYISQPTTRESLSTTYKQLCRSPWNVDYGTYYNENDQGCFWLQVKYEYQTTQNGIN